MSYTLCSINGLFNDELFLFDLTLFVSWPDRYVCYFLFYFTIIIFSSFGLSPLHLLAAFFRGVHSFICLHCLWLWYLCVTFVFGAMCDVCVNYTLDVYWTCTPFFIWPTRTIVCLCVCYLSDIFYCRFQTFTKSEQQTDKTNVSLFSKCETWSNEIYCCLPSGHLYAWKYFVLLLLYTFFPALSFSIWEKQHFNSVDELFDDIFNQSCMSIAEWPKTSI